VGLIFVMAAFIAAIHDFGIESHQKLVDGPTKSGHDVGLR
jgi:hypothetical protein